MRKIIPLLVFVLLLACNLPAPRPATPAVLQPSAPGTLPTAAISSSAAATVTLVSVPVSTLQIDGVPFQSYQLPGDPFRFVCQVPCGVDPHLIDAQYAGFRNTYQIMLKLTGVDILPELVPVDIHIKGDTTCGHMGSGPLAFTYFSPPKKPVICTYLFDYAQGFNGQPYSAEVAVRPDQQTIFVHEYLHLIFYGRFPGAVEAMHDFVTPLAVYIGLTGGAEIDPCSYHPGSPPGDFGGYLLFNLCQQNGFQLKDLAPLLVQMDKLYQTGAGQVQQAGYQHPVPSVLQFRDALNHLLGSDTTKAFAEACWPPGLLGDAYTLSQACTNPTATVAPTAVK